MAQQEQLEGGLTEAQWRRFEGPDYSQCDPRAVNVPLEQAVALTQMPVEEVGPEFLRLLDIPGTADYRWSSAAHAPEAGGEVFMRKYGFWLNTVMFDRPGMLIVDVQQNRVPTGGDQALNVVWEGARWLFTGRTKGGLLLPTDETGRVSSLMFPPPPKMD